MVDNFGSTARSIISCPGPDIFVQINRILTKFLPLKVPASGNYDTPCSLVSWVQNCFRCVESVLQPIIIFAYFCFCFCRPVRQYLDDLTPLFHVDYLLPRTLLSVMSLQHVEEVFASVVVPPDACLANAFYFVHTEKYLTEEVFLYPFLGDRL